MPKLGESVMSPEEVLQILKRPTITPELLWKTQAVPLGRDAIYEACKSGLIDSFSVGRKVIIKTAPLRKMLGMDAA